MSLYEPVPQVDLSPDLQPSHELSPRRLEDYARLFFWAFWRPHSLAHYLRSRQNGDLNPSEVSVDLTEFTAPMAATPYGLVEKRLFILSICLTLLIVSAISVTYWVALVLFQIPSSTFRAVGDLFIGLFAGILATSLAQAGIWAISKLFFPKDWADISVVAMLIFGIIWGTTASIYFLYPSPDDILFRSALISLAIGSTMGFVVSTPSYYIKVEAVQQGLIFVTFSLLAVLVFGIVVGGLQSGSVSLLLLSSFCIITSFLSTAFRVDDWIFGQLLKGRAIARRDASLLPRVTPIPIVGLRLEIEDWLDWDWQAGLQNIKLIREYTRQDLMTALAIRQILKESSEGKDTKIVAKVEQLQNIFSDMDLRHFSPEKLSSSTPQNVVRQAIRQIFWPTQKDNRKRKSDRSRQEERQQHRHKRWNRASARRKLTSYYSTTTLADATIAGYSYLSLNYPEMALPAFEQVTHDDLGKEMVAISTVLKTLWFAEKLPEKAPLELPKKPDNPQHKEVWNSFERFTEIVRYVWLLRRTRNANNYAFVVQQIEGKMAKLQAGIPNTVVGDTLRYIAADWTFETNNLINTIDHSERVKKIDNPYIFAEPLSGLSRGLLMGRKPQLDLIKAAWKVGNFQPILIHGQRQMGKTSLIRCADAQFSRSIRMAYINLRQLEEASTPADLFLTICDAVGGLRILSPPTDEVLSVNPYREFRQYIRECASRLGSIGLVIVMDELEHLTTNIERFKTFAPSIQQLWTLAQLEPNLGVVLMTTRRPSELLSANDHNLLTSTVQPVAVDYLSKENVAALLRKPDPKFLPYCTDKALDRILFWTHGQPYLTQLLAYYLVEHYNAQISALNGQRDPLFTEIDIDGTVQRTDFRRQCERFFQEILEEAVAMDGSAIDILDALSQKRMGLAANDLAQALGASADQSLLQQLIEHQIISFNNDRWQIVVELFRWWLRDRIEPK